MKQKRTIENNKDGDYMDNLENMTEQEFKADLKYRMEQDKLHPHCDCDICKETHKYFESNPDDFLESRWQKELERRNTPPFSKEEITNALAKYKLKIKTDGWFSC